MSDFPDFQAQKAKTMMRLGELTSFREDQRIAILEMVKDGSMSIEEAIAEVKRTNPIVFSGKYFGSTPSLEVPEVDEDITQDILGKAADWLKRTKPAAQKVIVTVSTVSIKIRTSNSDEDIVDTEDMNELVHASILPGNKKAVAFVVRYGKLGLFFTGVVQCAKAKEADAMVEALLERKAQAGESVLMASVREDSEAESDRVSQAADEDSSDDEDDEEDPSQWRPLDVFLMHSLGTVGAPDSQGDESVRESIKALFEQIRARSGGKIKDLNYDHGFPVAVVISGEGVRIVDSKTRELITNIFIKDIHYTTQILGKKTELFAFIEVDDRRAANNCHIFLCQKGYKDQAAEARTVMAKAFQIARTKAGNPFKAIANSREPVEGPLVERQLKRKHLTALKAIGAGQFGRVYLAEHKPPNQDEEGPNFVAVKMLRSGASDSDKKEFIREAETMNELGSHENLVSMLGVVVKRRPWLVVLEFCQYGDLSDVLKALRRKKIALTLAEQLHFSSQLASGMQYISSRNFVHMDLAARNCLLHTGNVLKVADFGLTHKFNPGKSYYKQVGVMKLSIRWLAIDALDYKVFSERSDVWSFGITVWEILSLGKQPYHGLGLQEVIKAVRGGRRLEQPNDCPDSLWEILTSCWIKEPTRRPTFRKLQKAIAYVASQEVGDETVRDVGSLLNRDLTKNLKQLSMKRRKPKTQAVPQAGPLAEAQEDEQRLQTLQRRSKITWNEDS